MDDPVIDQTARRDVSEVRHELRNHVQVTGIRLDSLSTKIEEKHVVLNEKFDQLQGILKWAGGLIITLMISIMAWSLLQQYNAIASTKTDMQQQISLLRAQEEARVQSRQEIMRRLPQPGATEPAAASDGSR